MTYYEPFKMRIVRFWYWILHILGVNKTPPCIMCNGRKRHRFENGTDHILEACDFCGRLEQIR